MRSRATNHQESLRHHYIVECDYTQKILKSRKHSDERTQLFADGYSEITKIIKAYNPGGGETDYTGVVAAIIGKLLKPGGSVFDIGCASGNLVKELSTDGYEARGIDISDELIEEAKAKLLPIAKSRQVEKADFLSYPTGKGIYDCVVMDNVIEHFHPDTVADILKKCHEIIKNHGYMIILTPHRLSGSHDISKYFTPLGSKASGFHLKEYSFSELYEHLDAAGFTRVLGFPFHPRLFRRVNIIPNSSGWAAKKAIFAEKLFGRKPLSKLLTVNGTLSRIIVALLFPSVCVAQK